jgi:2-hydroxychromene-2-carboxylate isomerase
MAAIDFWYSIGSTYSYLTIGRIDAVAHKRRVPVRWRPFDVRRIMVAQNNVPFRDKPVKAAYMWRDIERRAAIHGLTPKLPAPYPLPGLVLANRVAVLGGEEGWCEAYTRATYRRWFEEGQAAGEEPNLSASLEQIGQDPARVLTEARGERIAALLDRETDTAEALGIFGAPSFVVDGELFWGDDRLEDAIDWALQRW